MPAIMSIEPRVHRLQRGLPILSKTSRVIGDHYRCTIISRRHYTHYRNRCPGNRSWAIRSCPVDLRPSLQDPFLNAPYVGGRVRGGASLSAAKIKGRKEKKRSLASANPFRRVPVHPVGTPQTLISRRRVNFSGLPRFLPCARLDPRQCAVHDNRAFRANTQGVGPFNSSMKYTITCALGVEVEWRSIDHRSRALGQAECHSRVTWVQKGGPAQVLLARAR